MRVGVVGAGYVGLVAAAGLALGGHQTVIAEANPSRLARLRERRAPFLEPGLDEWLRRAGERLSVVSSVKEMGPRDAIVIAVGTPSGVSGQGDLTQVRQAVEEVVRTAAPGTVIVMKSTVPPGTGRELVRQYVAPARRGLAYVSNPEFLREGKALYDWLHPDRIVVGAEEGWAAERVAELYRGIDAPVLRTDITSAEMIKYAANALLATKISFINEIANLCELVGAHIDDVATGVGMDPRLGPHFLQAGIGYGGSCFPKDTRALYFTAAVNGYAFELLRAVIEVNRRQRIRVVHRLNTLLGGLAERSVAVLGLAFKPGTDDTRESPGLEIARTLAGYGAKVQVYDPVAVLPDSGGSPGFPVVLSPGLVRVASLEEAVRSAQAVVVATEWPEFVEADWERLYRLMAAPRVVFDGRNCLDAARLAAMGFRYVGVGRRVAPAFGDADVAPASLAEGTGGA